tara:strand:- start:100 stop:210 length:111 start_codon:yes stop_codon:yes gene_type:complete
MEEFLLKLNIMELDKEENKIIQQIKYFIKVKGLINI